MNASWSYSGCWPTGGFQEMKEQITWLILGANDRNLCPPPLPGSQQPAAKRTKMSVEKSHWRLQSRCGQDMSRPLYSGCEHDTVACEHTWSELASWTLHCGIANKRNSQSTTSSLAETETPVMTAGGVDHQQAFGNGRRLSPHHPIPGSMWTEGISTADWPRRKKKKNPHFHASTYAK